jgi:hypothetical protein
VTVAFRGISWYLVFATKCHVFFAVISENHSIFAAELIT